MLLPEAYSVSQAFGSFARVAAAPAMIMITIMTEVFFYSINNNVESQEIPLHLLGDRGIQGTQCPAFRSLSICGIPEC